MTFEEQEFNELQEFEKKQNYFVDYDQVWDIIQQFYRGDKTKSSIKGAAIDTLMCLLDLYDAYIRKRQSIEKRGDKIMLELDAFRIGKLAGYETSTIKRHMSQIREFGIVEITLALPEYNKGFYAIYLPTSFILKAEPMKLTLV